MYLSILKNRFGYCSVEYSHMDDRKLLVPQLINVTRHYSVSTTVGAHMCFTVSNDSNSMSDIAPFALNWLCFTTLDILGEGPRYGNPPLKGQYGARPLLDLLHVLTNKFHPYWTLGN